MSAENQESHQYPVDAIHYYPKKKRLVVEVEGGVTFALTQNPEGLFAQLLLNEAASQRAAILNGDTAPADNSRPRQTPSSASATESEARAEVVDQIPSPPAEAGQAQPEAPVALTSSGKKENQLILTGRLKTKPREGRYPDNAGRPTATALFAANAEGRDDAWMLSATFLRATVKVALGLEKDDQITVEGFANKNSDPTKNDYYSIFRFLHYPGKPSRDTER